MKKNTFLLILLMNMTVFADEIIINKELNLIGGYGGDFFTETMHHQNSIGFEYFGKHSNDYGDFLTADLQLRIAHNFEKETTTIEVHNAWLEYKLGLGKFIRLGHFAPAFGIEKVKDTHATFWQTNAMKNVGFKQDWGVGYRNFWNNFDYEFTAQIGSGMAIQKDGYLFCSRINTNSTKSLQFAVSALYGKIHKSMGMATYPLSSSMKILKKQIGFELQYEYADFKFMNEIAFGYDGNTETVSGFSEWDYTPFAFQDLKLIVQYKYFDKASNWNFGGAYKLHETITFSTLYELKENRILCQIHFFG